MIQYYKSLYNNLSDFLIHDMMLATLYKRISQNKVTLLYIYSLEMRYL